MFKLVLEKAEEPEIKLPTSAGSWKKQESSRKTSISALLTMPKPLTVWITINCGKFWKMGIPDHLTCLLRNLYAGQEATVRTGYGKTDWFQIRKGVHQGCILSPCLFNFYAEYIMRNARPEEAETGIKIARRNIQPWCTPFPIWNQSVVPCPVLTVASWPAYGLNMATNLENSAVATGLEKVSFHSNSKEMQCQRMLKLLHNCTHLTC